MGFVTVFAPFADARGPLAAGHVTCAVGLGPFAEGRVPLAAGRDDLSNVRAYISGVDHHFVDVSALSIDENFLYAASPRPISARLPPSPTRRAALSPVRASNLPNLEPTPARKK